VRFVVKVSKKGQVVIPIEIRRKFNIRDRVVIKADEEGIRIIPLVPLEELFGADGDVMRDVAREIVKERLEELRREE